MKHRICQKKTSYITGFINIFLKAILCVLILCLTFGTASFAEAAEGESPDTPIYTVISTGTTESLGGRTFAIVNMNTGNAVQGEQHPSQTNRLKAESVQVGNVYAQAANPVTMWTFEDAGDGKYYIKSSEGKYLNITGTTNNNGAVTISDTPQALNVTAGTGTRAGTIRITNDSGLSVNNYSGTTANGFGPYSDSGNNEWFNLIEMQLLRLYDVYTADKISVKGITEPPGNSTDSPDTVLIYKTVYNPATGAQEDYVIDGNGNLVRAYDKGDQITLRSEISPVWKVIMHRNSAGELNGYYDFYNEATGMYLSPQADGTLVSPTRPGVTLNGRRDGKYNSTIEKWDSSAWHWYGYHVNTQNGIRLESETGIHSQEFSFARYDTEESSDNVLHPVATVDSAAAGITIHMFNYPNRTTISNVTGSDSYAEGVLPAHHVKNTLVNGYPVFSNGNSGSALFSTENNSNYKGTGNHLFLESVYNSTGYYEYSAFNNFAHYNADSGNFTVYQETGTPSNGNNFYFKRGNFYPFNDLDVTKPATNTNQYNESGQLLDPVDPTLGGTLYLINNPDYYFGMTMEATFMQPQNGVQDEDPVVYHFNGDDDLWIFIDGVLVLDIGGVHDAWAGTINFATGEIIGNNVTGAGGATTIKDCFKNAGVFPDGTAWDDSRADQYFKGNTFTDYSSHNFKMFYMEHGAGASNLQMHFNLPVIEPGKFTVKKELDEPVLETYANVRFAYQAFIENGDDAEDTPLNEAVYEGTTTAVPFEDSVEINEVTYTNVFYLKPGEAAVFSVDHDNDQYYIKELGIDPAYYDKVYINDVEVHDNEDGVEDQIYTSTEATVRNRARVTYKNKPFTEELRITKALTSAALEDGSTFEFRILLENTAGQLVPYSTGEYYIQDVSGNYYRYVDGSLTNMGTDPVAASVTGNNGTIAGIPPEYTVSIKDLLPGTDFYVEEIRLPEGWNLESKTVAEGTYDASDLSGTDWAGNTVAADGQIKREIDSDVNITFTNTKNIKVPVSGIKILNGRDMEAGEFTFSMTPVDTDGNATGPAVRTSNTAGDKGEETHFSFPDLEFSKTDYDNAQYWDSAGNALFYYIVSEDIAANADENGFDSNQSIKYDQSQYLVVITLSYTDGKLEAEKNIYNYDPQAGIPQDLLPDGYGDDGIVSI